MSHLDEPRGPAVPAPAAPCPAPAELPTDRALDDIGTEALFREARRRRRCRWVVGSLALALALAVAVVAGAATYSATSHPAPKTLGAKTTARRR